MSKVIPTPEQPAFTKRQRVLACVLCQRRKIKCDRKLPCANCVRACTQCVPAVVGERQRRRRFPERDLLDRLRHYESMLRQNNIDFEPLHPPAAQEPSPSEGGRGSDVIGDAYLEANGSETDDTMKEKAAVKSKTIYEAKNLWHAMSQTTLESDNDDDDNSGFLHDNKHVNESVIKKAWDQVYESGNETDNHLLFGSRKTGVLSSTMHPEQVQIFRLWHIYLENVNPLLKVTHTSTLQLRIIDAASNMASISPGLEALLFSIYCISILSLPEDECCALFGSPRGDLLGDYQLACRQALLNCNVLQSGDRDCLTALYLYLVSVRPQTDPRSLSSMLGVAIRIAQRIGIHNESTYARCDSLEAEMRRRLWWSLIVFDNRICEMFDSKTTTLVPTWDCGPPLNMNDSDIRPEIKAPPAIHETPTEAIFVVVRSELANFVRHSAFYLDFTNPSLIAIAKITRPGPIPEAGEVIALGNMLEDKYLAYCNPENPLHFITIWTTRGSLAKYRLLEHFWRHPTSPTHQTDTLRDAAISHALNMLECDTKLMTSTLIKQYFWLVHFHFPFLAYVHILQELVKWPTEGYADKAWVVMSNNYEARIMDVKQDDRPFFIVFSRLVLRSWEVREELFRQQDKPVEPPRIVSDIRNKVMQMTLSFSQNNDIRTSSGTESTSADGSLAPIPMDFAGHGQFYGTEVQSSTGSGPLGYSGIPGQPTVDVDMSQIDLTAMSWDARGW